MSLSTGTRLGSYVITGPLGVGGMGEVYQAEDTELGRAVAIKALPESVAHDPERIARFEREAKLLAALNHPHIAAIYGVERVGDAKFLVLELISGASLADRLRTGPMPVSEAARIARQIAAALEAAHEKGIIHRDLKPANIMLTADDQVKVLDFGLAKALETEPASISPDLSPTLTLGAATQMGVVLGTASYMAPEQAKGRAADKRCDLWAFGCVLYELLTGTRAFQGDDVSEILASVIKGDPDWTRLPHDTPPALERLLRRCLAKDRTARIPDAAMARIEIDEALGHSASVRTTSSESSRRPSRGRLAAVVATAAVVAALSSGLLVWRLTRPDAPAAPQVGRFAVNLEPGVMLTAAAVQRFVIAPDGRHIVYNASGPSGTRKLYLRRTNQLESVEIQGTEHAGSLFVSPDGEWIGFNDTAAGSLRKVRVTGGSPATITEARAATGGFSGTTWGAKGLIVFATTGAPGLMKVADSGGVPEPLTTPTGERHVHPWFLPNGDALLFTVVRERAPGQIAVLSLATGETRELVAGTSPRYAASGHLVFLREGAVWAAPFDADRLAVTGTAVPVLEGVGSAGGANPTALLDLSASGAVIYSPVGAAHATRTVVWVDRQGREEPVAGIPARAYVYPRLSPDGRYIAFDTRDQDNDILTWDLERSVLTKITSGRALDRNPVWTPNGRRLAFASTREPPSAVYWQAADGTGVPERLTNDQQVQTPLAFTRDGARLILREEAQSTTASDLTMLTLGGTRSKVPLIQTEAVETNAEVSRDGRWLAYQSGREVWVRPFPDVETGRWHIGLGSQPLWSPDGRELFFLNDAGRLMGVSVQTAPTFSASSPKPLLDRAYAWSIVGLPERTYDISPDGRRFLMIKEAESAARNQAPQMVVVLNWHEELKRLAPTGQ